MGFKYLSTLIIYTGIFCPNTIFEGAIGIISFNLPGRIVTMGDFFKRKKPVTGADLVPSGSTAIVNSYFPDTYDALGGFGPHFSSP